MILGETHPTTIGFSQTVFHINPQEVFMIHAFALVESVRIPLLRDVFDGSIRCCLSAKVPHARQFGILIQIELTKFLNRFWFALVSPAWSASALARAGGIVVSPT